VGEPGGGEYRPYDLLVAVLVPAMRAAGITATEVDRLMMHNPRAAFTVRVRRAR
jgi:phosphotriesterase-related protein